MRTVTYEVPQLEWGMGLGTSTSLFFGITSAFYFCMIILVVTIHNYFRNFHFFTSYDDGKPAGVLEHCRER